MPAALTTVAARAAEGARAAFRPAELPLKDDCRRRRDERGERRERRRERGQSNVRDAACEKKKQNTIGEVSSHDSTILSSSVRRDRVIRSVARDRGERQPEKRESTRETRDCWEKTLRPRRDARLRGRKRAVTADARRASSSRDVPWPARAR